jgi:hypothetical protein
MVGAEGEQWSRIRNRQWRKEGRRSVEGFVRGALSTVEARYRRVKEGLQARELSQTISCFIVAAPGGCKRRVEEGFKVG